ncbi:MAG: DegT/DnrJ/EryC1/StrS family aminotransferase [Pseudomonadales bacterium]|nr:DegT/DnrJ/EryC1/StrS family aminotransferase [Pseudomonadales bacterium]
MANNRINVTKPHLPDRGRIYQYIDRALDSRWLTNDGPLVQELTVRLEDYLGVKHILLVANGTMGLLVALKLLGSRKVFTTPFSFPATSSAPAWLGADIRYGDISPESFNLVPQVNVAAESVDCILPTHVFGNPCDLDGMDRLSGEWEAPIVYDAAHAFGVRVDGKSILEFGDISVLSFHATKLFHCVEGGALRFSSKDQLLAAREMINFGFDAHGGIRRVGINAKMNELEAAMGLAVLDEVDVIMDSYRQSYELYDELLNPDLQRQKVSSDVEHNFSYFPVCFSDSSTLSRVVESLKADDIFARRYFEPSLDKVSFFGGSDDCKVSQDIASRILCLPMFSELTPETVQRVCKIVNQNLDS